MRLTNAELILTVDTRSGLRVKGDLAVEHSAAGWVVAVTGRRGVENRKTGGGGVGLSRAHGGWGWKGRIVLRSLRDVAGHLRDTQPATAPYSTGTFWQRSLRCQAPLSARQPHPYPSRLSPAPVSVLQSDRGAFVTTAGSRAAPQLLLFIVDDVGGRDAHFIASWSDWRHENGRRPVTSRRTAVRDVISQVRVRRSS